MPLQFPPRGTAAWENTIEQLLRQHDVDIWRLWKDIPQVADPHAGIPFTGPISPTVFSIPSSNSSVSSRSSNSSYSLSSVCDENVPGGLGECGWTWRTSGSFWEPSGGAGWVTKTGCEVTSPFTCCEPSGTGSFDGQFRLTRCCKCPGVGGCPDSCPSSTSSASSGSSMPSSGSSGSASPPGCETAAQCWYQYDATFQAWTRINDIPDETQCGGSSYPTCECPYPTYCPVSNPSCPGFGFNGEIRIFDCQPQ